MNDSFDFVSLIEMLDEHKKSGSKQKFLISFSGIIFEQVEANPPNNFLKEWQSEIKNDGMMTVPTAKTILNRSRKLSNKYKNQIIELKVAANDIVASIDTDIVNFIEQEVIDAKLREIIGKSTLSKVIKDTLLRDTDFSSLLTGLFLYVVVNDTFEYHALELYENKEHQTLIFLPLEELKRYDNNIDASKYRETFTQDRLADFPVFNAIRDNPVWGDERQFVRIRDVYSNNFINELEIIPNHDYEIMIFFHNNADSKYNYDEKRSGVAVGCRLFVNQPFEIATGEKRAITGIISAKNTNPEEVWAKAYIESKVNLTIEYVPGTAKIRTNRMKNESISHKYLFSRPGILLGYDKLNGLVPACTQYFGYVYYRIRTSYA